ncbi:hypothetical protein M433DRAFT_151420 [Acidomyces richmondensis BFW]|nr:MAG: hypothetical protein FE78DRAFT_84944 [Acidomyces sp. 'richmondensis']KYG48131.1 hypothetical protein M433DRAFT_151420 [Acidomyces richmondensis BFW]
MRTPLDRVTRSNHLFLGFVGIVTAVAAWAILGGDIIPQKPDPMGDPEHWSTEDMRRWLTARNLYGGEAATREELLARVQANMRAPKA